MRAYTKQEQEAAARKLAAVTRHYPVKGSGYLLTLHNPKILKQADARGYLIAVMHLAPFDASGVNVCAHSVPTCRAGCLTYAGRGGINLDASDWNATQAARIRRTARMILDPEAFERDLMTEAQRLAAKAEAKGLRLAVRLNGTSDIPWHRTAPDLVAELQSIAQTYEYTKHPNPDGIAAGIDVTYSYPGGNGAAARRHLEAGGRIAVVFDTKKGSAMPDEWHAPWGDTLPVIDGDAHDLRWLDPAGVVVGLRAKGRLRKQPATPRGFVQHGTD